jgi:hypothetical protein
VKAQVVWAIGAGLLVLKTGPLTGAKRQGAGVRSRPKNVFTRVSDPLAYDVSAPIIGFARPVSIASRKAENEKGTSLGLSGLAPG